MVYLRATGRPHPLVVVFDRVESTEPQYEKAFLLHAVHRPAVDGKRCVIENGGGRLTCLTLLPERCHLDLVGGPGNEFAVGGVNYPPERLPEPWKAVVGAWRLEVKPAERRKQDCFLHLLLVDDVDAPAVTRHLIVGGPLRGNAQWSTAQQSPKNCATGEGGCAVLDLPRGAAETMHVRFRP
jgi:heparin/heparan-sulfate lyase